MAKDDKAKAPEAGQAKAPEAGALPPGVRLGSFQITPEVAAQVCIRPEDFPGIGLSAVVKVPGKKSGKLYFAYALPECAAELLAKVKSGVLALLVLGLLLGSGVLAGTTNLDSLTLSDDLVVTDTATFSGAVALQGAGTVTADQTYSGNGVDVLFNADDENTIGSEAKAAKAIYSKDVDVDDDLTVDDDATVTDDLLVSGQATLTEAVLHKAKIFIDHGGTGTEAHIDGSGAAGSSSVRLDMDGDGFELLGPTDPGNGASVSILTATTTAIALKKAIAVSADMTLTGAGIDLLASADNVQVIGASGTEFNTAWVQTLDDGDGTVTVAAGLTVDGVVDASSESIAAATALGCTKEVVFLTGATAITSITITPYPAGARLTLCNGPGGDATGPVVTDGNNLKMAGNITLGPDDCVDFVSDGTDLRETGRSVN